MNPGGTDVSELRVDPATPRQFPPAGDDRFAATLRGFGPVGLLALLVIFLSGNITIGRFPAVPVGALLVLLWARLSRTSWRELGFVRPASWLTTLAGGIAFGITLKLVLKALVMPLLGADPVNRTYHFLAGNRALLPAAAWAMLVAGLGEETVFRGYLFERGARLFGRSAIGTTFTVLLTSALFAAAHYSDQGLPGVEQAAVTGLVFGTIFARTRRIFFLMIAHAAFDLTALALIYWDVESKVAHLVFR